MFKNEKVHYELICDEDIADELMSYPPHRCKLIDSINEPSDKVFDCKFCHTIYSDEDTNDIIFSRGKYSKLKTPGEFISLCEDGTYDINIDTGDPYESGILVNVKFCPYCGRGLAK